MEPLKSIVNLTVINEQQRPKGEEARRQISSDMLKKFKKHLLNKDFFSKLKSIITDTDIELQMTRNGGGVSDDYIHARKDDGELCSDETRKLVSHNADFRQYVRDNRQRLRTVVNKACNFEDGVSSGVSFFKKKKLNGKYESLERIRKNSRKVKASQEKAIVTAFQKFKNIKDSVFYEKNLESNPSVNRAVHKSRRKDHDEESDNY